MLDLVELKSNENPVNCLEIPIFSPAQEKIGRLRCIDRSNCENEDLIASLTAWRNASRQAFLTQFEATEDRTRNWLSKIVIPGEGKILFVIIDADGKLIGNVGLANVFKGSAEIDNVMRGSVSRFSGIAAAAVSSLLKWAFEALEVQDVHLHVFSNNQRAISLYEQIGFMKSSVRRLSVLKEEAETRYRVESDEGSTADCAYLRMDLERTEAS